VREDIRKTLTLERQKKINLYAREYQDNIMSSADLQWSDNNLAYLVERVKQMGTTSRHIILDSLALLSADDKDRALVYHKDGELTIDEMRERFLGFGRSPSLSFNEPQDVKEYVENFLLIEFLLKLAEKRRLQHDELVANDLRKRLENEMKNALVQDEVYSKANPNQEQIVKQYEEFKEELYCKKEKRKIQEILIRDKDLAEKVAERAKKGENFTRLARKYTERPGYKEKDGKMVAFEKGRYEEMGDRAFELKIGEISGPIRNNRMNGFSIIKLLDIEPIVVTPFEEVKTRVERDTRKKLRDELEEKWLKELRKKYRVHINEEMLLSAFAS
jgi:hypothetical protein